MPKHPLPMSKGWQFIFPDAKSVGYLTTTERPTSASESMTAVIAVATTGSPLFEYRTEPENTCDTPATVRLFFQRRGDDLSGVGAFEFYRWWSTSAAYRLGPGLVTLVGDLRDASQWTSVLGRNGAANEPMFRAALADLGSVGFTFGGGCFYGHGVYVIPGTGRAAFGVTRYAVR